MKRELHDFLQLIERTAKNGNGWANVAKSNYDLVIRMARKYPGYIEWKYDSSDGAMYVRNISKVDTKEENCPKCDGWGLLEEIDGSGNETHYDCDKCDGNGILPSNTAIPSTSKGINKPPTDKHDFDDVALF